MFTSDSSQRWQPPKRQAAWFWPVCLAGFGLWGVWSCFYSIPADSVGVLVRLGKVSSQVGPGLGLKIPWGVDAMVVVPIQRQLKLEFGFGTEGGSNRDQASREPELEKSMVTGDLNMASVEWVVQYRIQDPRQYLFGIREPGLTLRDASEAVMREVVGDRTVDEVLTVGRQQIEDEASLKLKGIAERYGLGVMIMQVQLKNVHPPRAVQGSFNEVNQAQQEKEQAINMANGEYNKAVPRAKGLADQSLREAEGYALKRVNEARGNAERFQSMLFEYEKAPEVTRQRLYLETMRDVLPRVERKIVVDEKLSGPLPFMNLEKGADKKGGNR
jgi:membrane protease subunit HflK